MSKNLLLIFSFIFQAVLFGQYQNIQVNNPSSWDPEEVTIAINTVNPSILAAGANISYFYRSSNAGASWIESELTSSLGVWGDPVVLFDKLGNLYFAHLSNPMSGYWIDRIVVQRSTNNGVTWNDGAGVGYTYPKNQDKEWLAVDMHSPLYKNNVYMSWTEFDDYGSSSPNDSSRILFSRSTDQGITWSIPVRLSDVGGNCIDEDNTVEGAVPTVGPNGEVYVSWAGPLGLVFDRSLDGGVTFGNDIFVTDIPGGWDYNVPGISRCNGLPITLCDTSSSPFRGNIYINWSDQRNGTTNTDVFFIKSTDGGMTWGVPVKVNDDNTDRHQFFTWMTIDQTTGIIFICFYDRRSTTGYATDFYVARSRDGGETFENFKVSQSSFTPSAGVFFGDYSNIAAYDHKVYPIWMRLDGGTLSVWTAPFTDTTSIVPVELTSFSASAMEDKIILTWQTSTEVNNRGFEIERRTEKEGWTTIGFVNGKGSTTEVQNYTFTDNPAVSGIYMYRLKQIDFNGTYEFSYEAEVSILKNLAFSLEQNYPNPFNPKTIIGYQLPNAGFVTLKVYDVLGNEITTLVNEFISAGVHEVEFNASDLTSGIYLYRITVGDNQFTRKMIFMK